MAAGIFKQRRKRGRWGEHQRLTPVDPLVIENQKAIHVNWAKTRGPGWVPNQREQSIMYREHVRALHPHRLRKNTG